MKYSSVGRALLVVNHDGEGSGRQFDSAYFTTMSKEHQREYDKARSRTEKGVISRIYAHQNYNSKSRGHNPPTYSRQELEDWLYKTVNFEEVFNKWVQSGYNPSLKPSIDRIHDYLGYSMDNIRLKTWGENWEKGNIDQRSGKLPNVLDLVAVSQYSLQGAFIKEFISQSDASRQTGIDQSSISKACKGKVHTAGGYIWKNKET